MTERVEISICTKDRASELYALLVSLRTQTYREWDLVIVDSSQPYPLVNAYKFIGDIITRIKTEGHAVKYIVDVPPMGVCKARNRAVKEGFGHQIIVRIDDDSVLEPDYIARLIKLMEPEDVGAVGGCVPVFGAPPMVRNINLLKGIFNRVKFDKEGNLTECADDGGFQYHPNVVLPSHHLRSSYAFRRKAYDDVGGFPNDYGTIGFREETDFCLRIAWKGWRMLTDTGAIAWHCQCPSGGARAPDYMQQVQIADEHFRTKMKWMFNRWGNP
jgi:GT2 family glycosyltransferase